MAVVRLAVIVMMVMIVRVRMVITIMNVLVRLRLAPGCIIVPGFVEAARLEQVFGLQRL